MPLTDDPALLSTTTQPQRGRAFAGLVLGLLWLTIAAGMLAVGLQGELMRNQLDTRTLALLIASLIFQIAPPVVIIILARSMLHQSGSSDTVSITALEARQARADVTGASLRADVDTVDRSLMGIGDRLAAMQLTVASDDHGLVATAERLEAATVAMSKATLESQAAGSRLQGLIDVSKHQAEAVTTLLAHNGAETERQLEAIETMLAGVWSRNSDAVAQVDSASVTLKGLLAGIESAAARATAAVGEHAAAMHGKADTAFDQTAAALASMRDGIDTQSAALLGTVERARVTLDDIGGEAGRAIGKRLDRLNDAAEQLGQRLTEQEARSRGLADTVERSFNVLDARLDHAAKSSYGALDGIAQRMAEVGSQVQTLNLPLRQTHGLTVGAETAIARLQTGMEDVTGALATALPVHTAEIAQLSGSLAQLHEALIQLREPVEQSRATIDSATSGMAAQRAHIEAATGQLAVQFEAARGTLAAIEAQADGSALAASSQLIEVLGRVREIAAATAGQMREALASVIAEAEAALAHAGGAAAQTAFGAPIRKQLVAIETASQQAAQAAQAAADRVAQRLLGLTGTLAAVEARIDEVQTHYDIQARDDLRIRSTRLIESLNAASIDVAQLLKLDVGDASWDAYLKGDRGIFTRRVVRLADGATARTIKRHYDHDTPFRELVVQFVDEFKRLLKYADADKDGRALAVTLLSSDIGKLYVVLEQAIGLPK